MPSPRAIATLSPRSLPAAPLLAALALVTACSGDDPRGAGGSFDDPSDGVQGSGVVLNENFAGSQIFPPSNWWNLDVTNAPIDPNSQAYIDWISGRTPQNPNAMRQLHPDFGPPPYGIPYVGVAGSQPRVPVTFVSYPGESDVGAPGGPPGYPIPDEARTQPNYIEGGVAGGGPSGDRHLLVIDRDNWLLFETWATRWNNAQSRWDAGSGAVWNLATNGRRPEGWTSADAAGLAIFPGLVKYDEAYGAGPITHAYRFTTRATNGCVWPASHEAGNTSGAPPMGARLRMKASKNISGYAPPLQKIFQGMKTHGLVLADNGTDMYITGTMDARWDNDILNPAFHGLYADDFEVIALGWNPTPTGVPATVQTDAPPGSPTR